jgi:hypothetical protein
VTGPEGRGDPPLVQEIRRLATAEDWIALREYIKAPPPAHLAETRTWFAKGGRTLLTQDLDFRLHGVISLVDSRSRSIVREMVTVAVSAPADAARFLPWRAMAWNRNVHILMLLDVLVSKGDDWCRRFVAAAISRNARAGKESATTVIRYCLPLILHFGVATEKFEAYPRLWAFYYRELAAGRLHEVWSDEIAADFEYPGWSGLGFRIDPAGRAVVFPKMQKSLLELWDQDLTAANTLLRCFDLPDALGPLARVGTPKEWTVGAAIRGYLNRGTFLSEEVFGKLRTALARDDGLPTQRVLADVLKSCPPSPGEVAASIPLLLSTVATAPGFLSFPVLGLLVQSPMGGGDLCDLSVAVFGRPEKKAQELLVRHLKSLQASQPYDGDVLAACWEAAAGSADLLVRATAEEMAGGPLATDLEEPLDAASLWGTGVRQPPEIPRYVAQEVDSKNPLPRWTGPREHSVAEEQYIDRFLRTVYRRAPNVRDWYRQRFAAQTGYADGFERYRALAGAPTSWRRWPDPPTSWRRWASPGPEVALAMWASGEHDLTAHRDLTALVRASLSRPSGTDDPFGSASPLAAIHILRQSELMVQAGTVPYSLATPSYDNFRVELGRLVSLLQLFEREGWAYGEADLFQALLRLGPMDAGLAAEVPELPVLPFDGPDGQERHAGQILREWVGGGGFKPPPVEAPLALPVSLERFPSVPPELLSPEVWSGSGRGHLGTWLACEASAVVPFWPDLGAVWLGRRVVYGGLVALGEGGPAGATAGELGQLTHDWFIAMLASHRPYDRSSTLETVLEMAARRQLSAEYLALAARNRLEAGDHSLGRLVRAMALVAYEGHLDCVWPALTALVVASSKQPRLPAGTSELLATCMELWESIPANHRTTATTAAFTVAVRTLAGAKTATKTGLEAKRLASRMGLTS